MGTARLPRPTRSTSATKPRARPLSAPRRPASTHTAPQYQTEIPRRPFQREFTIHFGQCWNGGRHIQGRHPLQTFDAAGAAGSQLGPDAQASFVPLNKGLGLSHGTCRRLFRHLFGIAIARATSVRSLLRTARRVEPAWHQQCAGHPQRRRRELLETALGGAARLPRRIRALIKDAFARRRQCRGHRLRGDDLAAAGWNWPAG